MPDAQAGAATAQRASPLLPIPDSRSESSAPCCPALLPSLQGVIHYNDAKIQLLDLPGIIEGAAEGRGRGRQVIAVCKSADLLLMVLDAGKPHYHREILTRELEAVSAPSSCWGP